MSRTAANLGLLCTRILSQSGFAGRADSVDDALMPSLITDIPRLFVNLLPLSICVVGMRFPDMSDVRSLTPPPRH